MISFRLCNHIHCTAPNLLLLSCADNVLSAMPNQSTLTPDEKGKVKAAISQSSNKILSACFSRLYFAHPQPDQWSYGGLQGALALAYDSNKEAYFFRMVDLDGTRGVIWEHELYEDFEYFQDRAWFHSFAGDVRISQSFLLAYFNFFFISIRLRNA
jgi:hypothetical protein